MKDNLYPIPINSEQFSVFIDKSRIFDKTREFMKQYLTSWYEEYPDEFVECMQADVTTVLEQYHFCDKFVSITKNYLFDPPTDEVSCTIGINNENGNHCIHYETIFDDQLNMIDDFVEK